MSLIAVRVAMARENFEDAPLTQEEQLMTAPPDVAAQDPEVAEAVQAQASDTLGADTMQLLDDGAAVSEVIDTVKEAGPEISPEAVLVAQERLTGIFRRYGLESRRIAREDITADIAAGTENPGPYSAAQDLITDAEKNLEYIKVAAAEGLRELGQRAAVNMQNMLKWRSMYVKDVRAVAKAAAAVVGTPNPQARYTNKVRIAHFTDGQRNPLTTAAQLKEAFKSSTAAAVACRVLQEQMERVFVLFFKGSGRVDLPAIAKAFEESSAGGAVIAAYGKVYSVSGKAAIFGEEMILTGLVLDKSTQNQDELLSAFADARFKVIEHWTVGDLDIGEGLPVMSAGDVASNANALSSMASGLRSDYGILDSLIDMTNNQQHSSVGSLVFSEAMDAITNPKLYAKYRNTVRRTIAAMAQAGDINIDLKAKALNCVLDYYKWSLNNHKNTSTEGFIGGLTGFIVGGFTGPIWGALSTGEGGRLRNQIIAAAKDIEKMQRGDVEEALKKGKVSKSDYDKIVGMDWKGVIVGIVGGTVGFGFYGAWAGSRLQNNAEELKEKIDELNKLIREEQKRKNEK